MDILCEFRQSVEDLTVLVVTANAEAETAVKAFQCGAVDIIGKPFNIESLKRTLNTAILNKNCKKSEVTISQILRKKNYKDHLIGNSEQIIELLRMVYACAQNDCRTVLVLGESGTGKDLVSRAIHQFSARSDKPFLDINCSAIPDNLLENELFGHEKGAYTDAADSQKGVFEMAEGGTIFLDEIGDMPLAMQAKILKVIESNTFRRLGGKEDLQANVRIIAATNQDLPFMIAKGKFRGDLFYRLNVISLHMPPLRKRKDDIPKLVEYFISRLNQEYGRNVRTVSAEAMHWLQEYDWPGNVRELRNIIERALMLELGAELSMESLPIELTNLDFDSSNEEEVRDQQQPSSYFALPEEGISLEEVEMELIKQALNRCNGNQTKAASYLKMSRDTLRYRMKKFGITDDSSSSKKDAQVGQDYFSHPSTQFTG